MPRRPIQAGIRVGPDETRDGSAATLREAFARWLTGVTIVAVRAGGRVHGMTVSAFAPLSLEPPLLLVSVSRDAPLLSHIEDAGQFTVNVLSHAQRGLATRFADRFPVGPTPFPADGAPVLEGALASFVCTLESPHEAGDHRLLIGRIERSEVSGDEGPLTYYRREYGAME